MFDLFEAVAICFDLFRLFNFCQTSFWVIWSCQTPAKQRLREEVDVAAGTPKIDANPSTGFNGSTVNERFFYAPRMPLTRRSRKSSRKFVDKNRFRTFFGHLGAFRKLRATRHRNSSLLRRLATPQRRKNDS